MFLYQKIKLQCLCFHVGSGQRIPDPVEEGSDPDSHTAKVCPLLENFSNNRLRLLQTPLGNVSPYLSVVPYVKAAMNE